MLGFNWNLALQLVREDFKAFLQFHTLPSSTAETGEMCVTQGSVMAVDNVNAARHCDKTALENNED